MPFLPDDASARRGLIAGRFTGGGNIFIPPVEAVFVNSAVELKEPYGSDVASAAVAAATSPSSPEGSLPLADPPGQTVESARAPAPEAVHPGRIYH